MKKSILEANEGLRVVFFVYWECSLNSAPFVCAIYSLPLGGF